MTIFRVKHSPCHNVLSPQDVRDGAARAARAADGPRRGLRGPEALRAAAVPQDAAGDAEPGVLHHTPGGVDRGICGR